MEHWPDLVIVGANHKSASLALRERLMVEEEDYGVLFSRLKDSGVDQALLLSTCDRVEVHTIHSDATAAAAAIAAILSDNAGIDPSELAAGFYTLEGGQAARHLFAIAASLDSLVIGEPNVLGQVKTAHRVAKASGMIGGEMDRLLDAAYSAAKRVRTTTAIGERPVSIAAAALDVTRDIHGDLGPCAGLLIGLGEMGEMVARRLADGGLGRLAVTHRRASRAAALARSLDANVIAYEDLDHALVSADVIVTCAGLGVYTITRDALEAALKARRRRPVFVIDLAAPRDADPAIEDLDGAFLYDSDDLEALARAGIAQREAAAEDAWRIVDETLAAYHDGRAKRAAAPAGDALRNRIHALREDILAEAGGDREKADNLMRQLFNNDEETGE